MNEIGKGGPRAMKIAGKVRRDAKEKYPNLSATEITKKAISMFESNSKKYI